MRLPVKVISFFCLLKYRLFVRRVSLGKGVIANWKTKIAGPGMVKIGDNVNLWAFAEKNQFLTYDPAAVIEIGEGTRVNGATLQARKTITIGKRCLLGSVLIMDNDFHHADPLRRFLREDIPTKPVKIGNNVWLAGRSSVLKGVNIGNNSVVAFAAVVSKDVPENVVVGGNPAIVVKEL